MIIFFFYSFIYIHVLCPDIALHFIRILVLPMMQSKVYKGEREVNIAKKSVWGVMTCSDLVLWLENDIFLQSL